MNMNGNPPVRAAIVDDIETHRTESRPGIASEEVFPQSVASGDLIERGCSLDTVDPEAYGEQIPLIVEVAEDERLAKNRRPRVIDPGAITPEHDYTVKVNLDELDLQLEADCQYYYQFEYDGVRSQVGRCRTLPDEDATPESVPIRSHRISGLPERVLRSTSSRRPRNRRLPRRTRRLHLRSH